MSRERRAVLKCCEKEIVEQLRHQHQQAPLCELYRMKAAIVFAVLVTLVGAAVAQQSVTDYLYRFCNTAIYSSNDSFAHNLDAVAKSLTQNSSEFRYSLASSETGSQSNHVYGIYQCRGDVSLSDCTSCVVNALSAFQSGSFCGSLARGTRAQYRGCYLRYESYKFYTGFEKSYEVQPTCTGSSNDSSPLYQQNLGTALNDSATAASRSALFGYNASSVGSGSNTAYALTQCYGYINSSQCADCLSQVSNYSNACNRSVSGEVHFISCYYLFGKTSLVFTYNSPTPSVNSPAPEAKAPSIASPSPAEKGKSHTATIVGIVVGVCALLAIITMAVYYLRRPKKSVKSAAEFFKAEDPLIPAGDQQLLATPGAKRFSLKDLQDATGDFHPSNKLGQGGFGPVYQVRFTSFY